MEYIGFIIGGIGSVIGVIGITLFGLSQKDIKSLIVQLEDINQHETNKRLASGSGNKLYKELIIKINESIDKKKESQREYIRMEKELKEAIANISHDLRTPLTSISGYLQLLEDRDIEATKKEEYYKIIRNRTDNLQKLVESFYELSRITSKSYVLELEEVNINRILCELIADFYEDFINKGLKLQINIAEEIPTVYANEEAITRVILNLIQNLMRYAKKHIEIQLVEKNHMVYLITRNELGTLNKEDVPYLFDRFFMADRVRNGEGTGIGLAVVKQLVMSMKGSVNAQVVENQIEITVKFQCFGKNN